MTKITPFLWFDKNLKEITDFYLSVFPEAKLTVNGTLSDTPSGEVEMATLTIFDQELSLMTAGPLYKFTEAISFVISCDSQEEIDNYWSKLSAIPESEQCGWCKDKYGLSWQVIPKNMGELMSKPGAMPVMLKMKKLVIADLEKAGQL